MNRIYTNARLGLTRPNHRTEAWWSVNCEQSGASHGLSAVCNVLDVHAPYARPTPGCQFRSITSNPLPLWRPLSHTPRSLFHAPFCHAGAAYSALSGPAQCTSFRSLQLALATCLGGHSPDVCTSLSFVCASFAILRRFGAVQSVRAAAAATVLAICCSKHFTILYSRANLGLLRDFSGATSLRHVAPAHAGLLLGALHEPCAPFVHVRRLLGLPAPRLACAAIDGWWHGFRRCWH